jgi:uncharacterized surface protein with fasciclin (FAS1) repeats
MRRSALLLSLLAMAPALASAQDIVDTAAANPNFSTLVTAVKAAGLVDTLKSPGPFTVFAPTNDAFAKLPAGTLDNLLKPENREQLTRILTYHVVPGRVPASEVVKLNGQAVPTVAGPTATVTVDGTTVKVGDANVTQTDVAASNGVIHVIDSVLLPPPAAQPVAPSSLPAPAPATITPEAVSHPVTYSAPAVHTYPAQVYYGQPAASYGYAVHPAPQPVYHYAPAQHQGRGWGWRRSSCGR